MKTIFKCLILVLGLNSFVMANEVSVPSVDVYAPHGFDSNDPVEIIVEGYLPNLCHSYPRAKVIRNGNNIFISVVANHSGKEVCAEVAVGFLEVAKIGHLPEGRYTVHVTSNTTDLLKSELVVAPTKSDSSHGSDDYIYARVDYIQKQEGSRTVLLKGVNPSPCFQFSRFELKNNGVNTYSILPIMKQISKECPARKKAFSLKFDVPEELKSTKVLLHVRSMDGKSINRIWSAL